MPKEYPFEGPYNKDCSILVSSPPLEGIPRVGEGNVGFGVV